MLLDYFKQYIKISRGVSDSTVGHYITAINTINSLLVKYDYPIKNVFSVKNLEELDGLSLFLEGNEEYKNKDAIGHNMYSAAFHHFYRFANEDGDFFSNSIETMDIQVAKPEIVTSTSTGWRRNQILVMQAIDGAQHKCEHNNGHETFLAKSTGKAYMEGHHLIPLKYQNEFSCGIDVYANIVCLCPVCHRLLHFGRDCDRRYVAEQLYESRQERLWNSGIDLSKEEFLDLVI